MTLAGFASVMTLFATLASSAAPFADAPASDLHPDTSCAAFLSRHADGGAGRIEGWINAYLADAGHGDVPPDAFGATLRHVLLWLEVRCREQVSLPLIRAVEGIVWDQREAFSQGR